MAKHRIAVPTKECLGVDVNNGFAPAASYTARNGFIETDNTDHAKAIKRQFGSSSSVVGFTGAKLPAITCICGREIFALFGTRCVNCKRKEKA